MLSLIRTDLASKMIRRFSTIPCRTYCICDIRTTCQENETPLRRLQGRSPSCYSQCRRFAAYPPLGDYGTERKRFKLAVPQQFNFARDVIDRWAEAEVVNMKLIIDLQFNNNYWPLYWENNCQNDCIIYAIA